MDSGLAQHGYKAKDACIAFRVDTIQLHVTLQAKDSPSVQYRHLSPIDRRISKAARSDELKGLLYLVAYRILSVEESIASRHDCPDMCYHPDGLTDGNETMTNYC